MLRKSTTSALTTYLHRLQPMAMTSNHQPAHFCEPSSVRHIPIISTILVFLSLATTLPSSMSTPIPKGFSLELIHRDSPRSPFYTSKYLITPGIIHDQFQYLVNITLSLGDQSHFLAFDTGTQLTWTQCKPCIGCPRQANPPFDMDKSLFYHPLPCSDPLCRHPPYDCTNNICNYTAVYGGQRIFARGYLSSDYFMFDGTVSIRITFGCTQNLNGWRVRENGYPEGILGMNGGPLSFPSQLRAILGISRFSHCFPKGDHPSFLRFESDILMDRPFQHIPFSDTSASTDWNYFFDLLDISINSAPLNIEPGDFAFDPRLGTGGFFLDSGAYFSRLIGPVYDRLMSVLVIYFELFHLKRTVNPGVKLDLCYERLDGIEGKLPTMTLHFEEAELLLTPDNLFVLLNDRVCWAMVRSERHSILGGFQQRNVRFVFDLERRELQFAQEDCGKTG